MQGPQVELQMQVPPRVGLFFLSAEQLLRLAVPCIPFQTGARPPAISERSGRLGERCAPCAPVHLSWARALQSKPVPVVWGRSGVVGEELSRSCVEVLLEHLQHLQDAGLTVAAAGGHILLEQLVQVEGRKLGRGGPHLGDGCIENYFQCSFGLRNSWKCKWGGQHNCPPPLLGQEPWDGCVAGQHSCSTRVTHGHPAAHMNLVPHF